MSPAVCPLPGTGAELGGLGTVPTLSCPEDWGEQQGLSEDRSGLEAPARCQPCPKPPNPLVWHGERQWPGSAGRAVSPPCSRIWVAASNSGARRGLGCTTAIPVPVKLLVKHPWSGEVDRGAVTGRRAKQQSVFVARLCSAAGL